MFQKSLKYERNNFFAAGNLGALYAQGYNYRSALEYLDLAYHGVKEELSITNPDLIKTGIIMQWLYHGLGCFRKANRIFEELIENNPKEVELVMNYAILLGRNMKRKKKALKILKRVDFLDNSGLYTRRVRALRKYLKSIK